MHLERTKSEGEDRARERATLRTFAKEAGRYEVAFKVEEILSPKHESGEMTPEEERIWDIVHDISERAGAT